MDEFLFEHQFWIIWDINLDWNYWVMWQFHVIENHTFPGALNCLPFPSLRQGVPVSPTACQHLMGDDSEASFHVLVQHWAEAWRQWGVSPEGEFQTFPSKVLDGDEIQCSVELPQQPSLLGSDQTYSPNSNYFCFSPQSCALCLGITPWGAQGTIWGAGMEPRSVVCEATALFAVLSLQTLTYPLLPMVHLSEEQVMRVGEIKSSFCLIYYYYDIKVLAFISGMSFHSGTSTWHRVHLCK